MKSIKQEFNNTNFNYDRTFEIVDALPYQKEYIIQPNELSYYNAFNLKLSYLYDNFLYIYSRCSFPNFNIPTTFTGFIGVTGNDLGIYRDTDDSEPFSNANLSKIDGAKNGVVYKNNNSYYLFMNCVSAIAILQYSEDNHICQSCTNAVTTVDPISGELTFQKINSISILENKYLCVSDEILDVVYKYDLETYFSNENIYKAKSSPFGDLLFLLDSVGGQGGRYDSIKFESPRNIPTHDNLILVEDYGNKIFKLFNSNLDFLSYRTFITLYNSVTGFESIKFKNETELYGIVKDGYYVFDINLETYKINLKDFHSLSAILYDNEEILDIEFCNYDNDIVYILTNKGFIKKWENLDGIVIGRKNATDFGTNSKFKWFTTLSKTTSSDNIHIYFYNSTANANQILIYEDDLNLISIFNNDDFNVYSRQEIEIKKNEWNQAWVYEKNIKKLAKNCDILKNNIYYNIIRKKGDFDSIIDLKKIYNKFIFNENAIDYDSYFSIGVNENFQSSVVNRELERIYDLQTQTLSFILLDNDLDYNSNIDFPTPTPTPSITPTPTPTPLIGNGIVRLISYDQVNRFVSSDPMHTFTSIPISTGLIMFNADSIIEFDGDDLIPFP